MRPTILIATFFLLFMSSCATRIVTRPTTITVAKKAPRHYKLVTVKGKRYYFWNGKHYKKTRKGYVIVRV